MNHVMLGLETMGTTHDAAIIAIGAVAFDDCPFDSSSIRHGVSHDHYYA